jgi:putative transposase
MQVGGLLTVETKSTKNARYNLNYHLVWCPKYRREVLTGLIASRLTELFGEIAKKWDLEIIAQEVMPDHIHLFVSAPPKYSPAKIAQLFKGTTSRVIRLEFPEVKRHIRKAGTLWSAGYYVGTAGNVSSEVIRRYIQKCQKI